MQTGPAPRGIVCMEATSGPANRMTHEVHINMQDAGYPFLGRIFLIISFYGPNMSE